MTGVYPLLIASRFHVGQELPSAQREYESPVSELNYNNRLITVALDCCWNHSGLFGAGGGLMFLLVLLIILKYPTRIAIGTSSLIIAMTSASGTIGYAMQGNVDYKTGAIIAVAAIISGILGAKLANKVDEKILNRIVGSMFAVIGILMYFLKS